MKKQIDILFLLLAMAASVSCLPGNDMKPENDFDKVTISAPNFIPEEVLTKTSLTIDENAGAVFSWKAGDVVGICPDVGTQVRFPIIENLGTNTNQAKFTGGGWAVKGAHTYMAYYPFISDMELDKTAVPVDYTGQVQVGSGTTDHLSSFDYMAAAATAPSDGEVSFTFQHLGALLMLNLTVPKIAQYDRLILTCDDVPFVTEGTVDITAGTPAVNGTAWSNDFIVNLNSFATTSRNQAVTVFALIAPVDMSGKEIRVRLEGSQAYCETSFTRGENKPFLAGKSYRPDISKDPESGDIILVENGNAFNVAIKTLANGEDFTYDRYDNSIKHLVFAVNVEDHTITLPYVDVSDTQSADNIYAIWDEAAETMTIETPANKLYMNDYAQGMFYRLNDLEDITGMEYLSSDHTTDMSSLFEDCYSLKSLDLTHLKVEKNQCARNIATGCATVKTLDFSNMDTSAETYLSGWLRGCNSLTSVNLGGRFSTAAAEDLSEMFKDCSSLTQLDLSNFNTAKVTNMAGMFYGCKLLASIDITHFDAGKVTDMSSMFSWCEAITSLDLSHFIAPKLTNMDNAFSCCVALSDIDFGDSFDTHNVENMNGLFAACCSLVNVDLRVFNTSSLRVLSWLFGQGSTDGRPGMSIKTIDLSSFDTSHCMNLEYWFAYSDDLVVDHLILGSGFVIRDDAYAESMLHTTIKKITCLRATAEKLVERGLVLPWTSTEFEIIDDDSTIYHLGVSDGYDYLDALLQRIGNDPIHLIDALQLDSDKTLDLNGKTLIAEGGPAIIIIDGSVKIKGNGSIERPAAYSKNASLIQIKNGTLNIENGTFVNNSADCPTLEIGESGTSPTLEINGGIFKNLAADSTPESKVLEVVSGSTPTVTISGGTFYYQCPPNSFLAPNHSAQLNSDKSYTVTANQ